MLDTGSLRIGGERYAEANGSRGLSTLLCAHVSVHKETVMLCFPAKSGQLWDSEIADADLARFVRGRLRRGSDKLLLSWNDRGSQYAMTDAAAVLGTPRRLREKATSIRASSTPISLERPLTPPDSRPPSQSYAPYLFANHRASEHQLCHDRAAERWLLER